MAVTIAVPSCFAVTIPDDETVATVSSEDDHKIGVSASPSGRISADRVRISSGQSVVSDTFNVICFT